jgi:hypothetical protein
MPKRISCILVFAILLVVVGCASQGSVRGGACRAATGSQPTQADAEPNSSQRIVDMAVSMQGCHADEVGTNVAAWPFALACYLKKKGPGPHDYEPWCSEFVCWAYAAAGWPLAPRAHDGWMLKDNKQLRAWFIRNRRFVTRNDPAWVSLIPQPGDFVRFDNAAGGHSAIVRSVSGPDLNIVEGNSRNQVRFDTVKDFRNSNDIDGIGLRLAP